MLKAGGFALRLSTKRQSIFEDEWDQSYSYAEAVDEFSFSRKQVLVCFVVDPAGIITHFGLGRRGLRAGAQQRRLNIGNLTELSQRVIVADIVNSVPKRNRAKVEEIFKNGGLFTPAAFNAVIDAIIQIAPEMRGPLQRFSEESRERFARLSEEVRDSLAYQKESVATALSLSGIDRTPLGLWAVPDDSEGSYLDGLEQTRMREDPMVFGDMMNVPGYDYIKSIPRASTTVFEDAGTKLFVTLANRQPLEEQTGTDLIYYNETFKAFIMVQYKAMEQDDKEGAIYRYPEQQLTDEITRMDAMLAVLAEIESSADRNAFRFNTNPFFLKFCPRLQFDPTDTGLVKGMYLPLDYWKRTENDPAMKGPRKGNRLTYKNVGRHLDNTAFATLVSRAWVGTSVTQSKLLEDWIHDVLKSGRAVTFAVKQDKPDSGKKNPVLNPVIIPGEGGLVEQVQQTKG